MIGYFVLLQLFVFIAVQARPNIDNDVFEEFVENDPNINRGFNIRAFRKDQLDIHNYYRKLHGVPKMRSNNALTAEAQKYAEVLASKNSGLNHCRTTSCNRASAGENLAMSGGSKTAETNATKAWYDEILDYDFCFDDSSRSKDRTRPGHAGAVVGHFTQVVWKDSTKLGIGYARSKDRKTVYVVGRYLNAGNVRGRFEENVLFPKYFRSIFQDNCKGTSGRLTSWSRAGKCSHSCGGGIQLKTRSCTSPKPSKNGKDCDGKTKIIAVKKWCNVKSCPGDKSYRELQCEKHGRKDDALEARESPCTLYCKPLNGGTYDYLGEVEDGTHCNSGSGVCIAGVCKAIPVYVVPVETNAAGKVTGEYKGPVTKKYYDTAIFTLPIGATNVKIINKSLRVKIDVGYKSEDGWTGVNWKEGPRARSSFTVKGVSFKYSKRSKSTKITSKAPIEPDAHHVIVLYAEGSGKADITWSYKP